MNVPTNREVLETTAHRLYNAKARVKVLPPSDFDTADFSHFCTQIKERITQMHKSGKLMLTNHKDDIFYLALKIAIDKYDYDDMNGHLAKAFIKKPNTISVARRAIERLQLTDENFRKAIDTLSIQG